MEEPSLIIGRAAAAWANPPHWGKIYIDEQCTREEAELAWMRFIEEVCANWGLALVPIGVIQEIEADH